MGDNQEITVSAPGKIILTGEHAVSFGKVPDFDKFCDR